MNGSISKVDFAKLNVPAPSAVLPVAAPANVQLQRETIKKDVPTNRHGPGEQGAERNEAAVLAQLDRLYDQAPASPSRPRSISSSCRPASSR